MLTDQQTFCKGNGLTDDKKCMIEWHKNDKKGNNKPHFAWLLFRRKKNKFRYISFKQHSEVAFYSSLHERQTVYVKTLRLAQVGYNVGVDLLTSTGEVGMQIVEWNIGMQIIEWKALGVQQLNDAAQL